MKELFKENTPCISGYTRQSRNNENPLPILLVVQKSVLHNGATRQIASLASLPAKNMAIERKKR